MMKIYDIFPQKNFNIELSEAGLLIIIHEIAQRSFKINKHQCTKANLSIYDYYFLNEPINLFYR